MRAFIAGCTVTLAASLDGAVLLQSHAVEGSVQATLQESRAKYSAWTAEHADMLSDDVAVKSKLKETYVKMRGIREKLMQHRDERTRSHPKFDAKKAFANLTTWLTEKKHTKVKGWYAQHAPKLETGDDGRQWAGIPTLIFLIADVAALALAGTGFHCPLLNFGLYYLGGALVMMLDQQLSFDDVALVMAQQVTTVGYGSSTVDTYLMKLYHAFHAFLGVTEVAPELNKLVVSSLFFFNSFWKIKGTRFEYIIPAALETIVATMVLAEDFHQADSSTWPSYGAAVNDALYVIMATASSIGYGDFAPSMPWAKLMTPFMAQALTVSFGEVAGHLGEIDEEDPELPSMNFVNDWFKACSGKQDDPMLSGDDMDEMPAGGNSAGETASVSAYQPLAANPWMDSYSGQQAGVQYGYA